MAVTADMLNLKLAEEVMNERGLEMKNLTVDDFYSVAEGVLKKVSLLPREGLGSFSPQDTARDDDQLRAFFLGD